MAIKCSSCGGEVKYRIKAKDLYCEHCGKSQKIDTIQKVKNSEEIVKNSENYDDTTTTIEESKTIETKVYQCGECGAEVQVFSEESTVFCPYCGKQTFLQGNEEMKKPDSIIPFKIDRDELKQKYERHIESKCFVPADMKEGKYINGFKGVYIPHWNMSVKTNDEIVFEGHKYYTRGNYNYSEKYDIETIVEGSINDITFDASANFDDTIATEIAPFDLDHKVPFQEGYVAGFFADNATADSNIYKEKTEKEATKAIKDCLQHDGDNDIKIDKPKKKIQYEHNEPEMAMLPVWFLTRRNKDRVSYAVVNGQTGKMKIDLPVDKKSFFTSTSVLSIIFAIVCAFIFNNILYGMTAVVTSYLTLIILSVSSLLLYIQTKFIYDKDNNKNNLGLKKKEESSKIKITKTNKNTGTKIEITGINKKSIAVMIIVMVFIAIFGIVVATLSVAGGTTRPTLGTVIATIPLILMQNTIRNKIKKVNYKKVNNLPAILITIIATVLYLIALPSDWYYYGLSALAIAGIVYNGMQCINGFDYLTSRPVPNFFKRGEQ